jgi:glycosyltransferase involved in cell wall biosynthesis
MRTNENTVSVVVPSRRGGANLERQLLAILGQDTDEEFEIVVVDNGSDAN